MLTHMFSCLLDEEHSRLAEEVKALTHLTNPATHTCIRMSSNISGWAGQDLQDIFHGKDKKFYLLIVCKSTHCLVPEKDKNIIYSLSFAFFDIPSLT